MAVQEGTKRYNQRYIEVHEGTQQYKNRLNCTGWYVLARTYPAEEVKMHLGLTGYHAKMSFINL
jgi:hypothetical protein